MESQHAVDIAALNSDITSLKEQLSSLENQMSTPDNKVAWGSSTYNYLAIGNSITVHGLTDYWWNNVGMAASRRSEDYVHKLETYLENRYGDVTLNTINLASWEAQSHDRAEFLSPLVPYLDANIDLITIQLGENAHDLETFESDFEYLIRYLQSSCPNAKIIVVGDFWSYENRDSLKETAAQNCDVSYVSLANIKDNPSYQAGLGTTVYDSAGDEHIIGHEGVARHPNDSGMTYIAEAIEKVLE